MAGLFDKDLRILLQRKQAIVMFLVIAVILGFSTGGTFVVGYTTFCLLILAVSTISYDEFDNGFSFLMTLPITRQSYVVEKYILCSICGVVAWIFSVVICICENQYKQVTVVTEDLLMEAAIMLPIVLFIMDIMIPVQIKYGSEKSRIVLISVMGIVMIVGIGVKKAVEMLDLPLESLFEKLQSITEVQVLVGSIIFIIVATLLSFAISYRIMNNKEF
ncbi:MAG: ABC-2 transporter permease [Agathobacter sp.]|nr:ABC-2 transporter permease [Agathobacter sp.]